MTSVATTKSLERQPVRGGTSCRHCGSSLDLSLVDLGKSPLCQTVLTEAGLGEPEIFYPLHAKVCTRCWLVQIPEFVPPEGIFTEYAYFSAYSDSWVEHARKYVEMIVQRLSLTPDDLVVELASNDGYLLQHFLPHGVPVLGIDPARNVAEARDRSAASRHWWSSSGTGLAGARSPRDGAPISFSVTTSSLRSRTSTTSSQVSRCSWPRAVRHVRVPSPGELVEHLEYDTIYHEHFSYFSLYAIREIFVPKVWRWWTSRRSRHTVGRCASSSRTPTRLLMYRRPSARPDREGRCGGPSRPRAYRRFAAGVEMSKRALLDVAARRAERRQAGRRIRSSR